MISKLVSLSLCLVFLNAAIAQNADNSKVVVKQQKSGSPLYRSSFGVKVFPFALDAKFFVGKKNRAIEFIGYIDDGFRLTGLYEFHGDLNGRKNLKFYFGIGAHGGYYETTPEEGISAGFDGVVGLDYKFLRLPLALALDFQPSLELVTPKTEFQPGRGGLSVRFAF
jgi:hypothetical protein